MKKALPLLAVLGGAAALVLYKMKKDEQKKIADLDEGLLYDEDLQDEEPAQPEDVENTEEPEIIITNKEVEKEEAAVEEKPEEVAEERPLGIYVDTDNLEYDDTYTDISVGGMKRLKDLTEANIAKLTEQGDVHEKERPVKHTLYFESADDMNAFNHEVINRGYVVTKGETDQHIVVLHITPIDEEKLLSHVYYLANATNRKGAYVDWETNVVTE